MTSKRQRFVVKLGTQVVMQPGGHINTRILGRVVQWLAEKQHAGHSVMLVTSGAVGLGRQQLGFKTADTLAVRQALAAVGQTALMQVYQALFRTQGLSVAQVLLSASDFADRRSYLNLKDSLEQLLAWGVVPIINENDVVSTTELREDAEKSFGDNDRLSALLASNLDADLLVILTNVNGLYTRNPFLHPDAVRIPLVEAIHSLQVSLEGQSDLGRGGMQSKLVAARIAAQNGVATWITHGDADLDAWDSTERSGTWILPLARGIRDKAQWIGYASGYVGVLTLNTGAVSALFSGAASLLPVGLVQVSGQFSERQVVSLQTEAGDEVGRGLVLHTADRLRQFLADARPLAPQEVIHRDNLVLF
jgi:glutamate 5-kinase